MKVLQKYRLELHWSGVKYTSDNVAFLEGAYFCGPVLKHAARINPNDQITIDMTQQHLLFVPDYYQAVLKWGEIEYKEDRVLLSVAILKGKHVNSIETLKNSDWILIDCSDHESRKHPFHLVYWAQVCKADGEEKF